MDRIAALREMIIEDPHDPFPKYALALELVKRNEPAEAGHWFAEITRLHADYLPAYYHHGKLEEQLGHKEKAILCYEKGMALARKQGDRHTLSELTSAREALD